MTTIDSLIVGQSVGLLVLRLVLASIFVVHALPKLKQPEMMAKGLGMTTAFVRILGFVELICGLGVAIGFYAQICAIALAVVMLGALYYKISVWKVPFSARDKTGWEFDLLILASALIIITTGSGSIGF